MPSTIAYGFACVIVWPSYFSYFWASYDLPSVRDARWRGHWEKLSPCKQSIGNSTSYARRSFSTTKRSIELAAFPHQETVLQAELDAASYCFASQEAKEGFAAFRKRKQES
jgi:hypothetical protein